MMQYAQELAISRRNDDVIDPVQIMTEAFDRIKASDDEDGGACTVLLATVASDGTLTTANLGDSHLLVIRNGEMVFMTEETKWQFNVPYMLESPSARHPFIPMERKNVPKDSVVQHFQLMEQDIIVMGTDGLWDNLFPSEIIKFVNAAPDQSVQGLVEFLGKKTVDASQNRYKRSPFMIEADLAGFEHQGGKKDDCTMIVARVVQDSTIMCPTEVLTHPRKRGIEDNLQHPEVATEFERFTPEIESNYKKAGFLGKGAFGEVVKVKEQSTGRMLAMKKIPMFGSFALKTVTTEVAAMREMGPRRFVVGLEKAYVSNAGCNNFILVYELCDESLTKWISRQIKTTSFVVDYANPTVTETHLQYAQELILALECLCLNKIIHRDLKPDNILIKDGHVKIGDFGVALVNRMSNRQAVIGDLYFIDQKTLVDAREPPAYLDDIYSMGQVFVRMFYGKYATANELRESVKEKKANGEHVTHVQDLIFKMTNPRTERIMYADMRAHPLFQGRAWSDLCSGCGEECAVPDFD